MQTPCLIGHAGNTLKSQTDILGKIHPAWYIPHCTCRLSREVRRRERDEARKRSNQEKQRKRRTNEARKRSRGTCRTNFTISSIQIVSYRAHAVCFCCTAEDSGCFQRCTRRAGPGSICHFVKSNRASSTSVAKPVKTCSACALCLADWIAKPADAVCVGGASCGNRRQLVCAGCTNTIANCGLVCAKGTGSARSFGG